MYQTHRHLRDIVKDTGLSINTVRAIIRDNGSGADHAGYTSKTLRLLLSIAHDSKETFRQAYEGERQRLNSDDSDAYYETLMQDSFGDIDGLCKTLDAWLTRLESLDDSPHTRGAAIALVMFKDYLTYVDSLNPIPDERALAPPESEIPPIPPVVRQAEPPKQTKPSLAPKQLEDYEPGATRATVLGNLTKIATAGRPKPKSTEDYPAPWCTVKNTGGAILRYEDATGKPIPKELWPTRQEATL